MEYDPALDGLPSRDWLVDYPIFESTGVVVRWLVCVPRIETRLRTHLHLLRRPSVEVNRFDLADVGAH